MNHGPKSDQAWIEYTMTVDDSPRLIGVRAYWVGVVPGCGLDPIFDVPGGGPPGSVHTRVADVDGPAGRPHRRRRRAHARRGAQRRAAPARVRRPRAVRSATRSTATPDHAYYHVLPNLHEPGPDLELAHHDADGHPRPQGRAAAGRPPTTTRGRCTCARWGSCTSTSRRRRRAPQPPPCAPLPTDRAETMQKPDGRLAPPAWVVPLTGIGADGRAREIERPPGAVKRLEAPGTVVVNVTSPRLRPGNLDVPAGTTLRWRFADELKHDITVADAPFGVLLAAAERGQHLPAQARPAGGLQALLLAAPGGDDAAHRRPVDGRAAPAPGRPRRPRPRRRRRASCATRCRSASRSRPGRRATSGCATRSWRSATRSSRSSRRRRTTRPPGRHLDRRGDGGYMVMFQLDDLDAARERADGARGSARCGTSSCRTSPTSTCTRATWARRSSRSTAATRRRAGAGAGRSGRGGRRADVVRRRRHRRDAALARPGARWRSGGARCSGAPPRGGTIDLDGGELRFVPGEVEGIEAFHVALPAAAAGRRRGVRRAVRARLEDERAADEPDADRRRSRGAESSSQPRKIHQRPRSDSRNATSGSNDCVQPLLAPAGRRPRA